MFGVIVSAATGRIRWHTDAGHPKAELQTSLVARKGETVLLLEDAQYGDLAALQATVSALTGLMPANDRYAIVDATITDPTVISATGNVIGAIIADPLCGDAVPNCQLIADPAAGLGWKWTSLTGFVAVAPAPAVIG